MATSIARAEYYTLMRCLTSARYFASTPPDILDYQARLLYQCVLKATVPYVSEDMRHMVEQIIETMKRSIVEVEAQL